MNNNTPAKQKHYGLPHMSQNTKYVICIISLLFIFTVGYSGYIVYQNKHNHKGLRFSFINLITGKDSTPASLKNSKIADLNTKRIAQYSAPVVTANQEDETRNTQKLLIINFYTDYLNNKKAGRSQEANLAKYGTANLAAQYENVAPGKDVLTCATDLGASAIITPRQVDDSPNPSYSVSFQDSQKKQLNYATVNLIQKNDGYVIDSVGCPR